MVKKTDTQRRLQDLEKKVLHQAQDIGNLKNELRKIKEQLGLQTTANIVMVRTQPWNTDLVSYNLVWTCPKCGEHKEGLSMTDWNQVAARHICMGTNTQTE